MADVEDEIIVAAHVIKALIEKLYRAAKERRNEKVQEDMKGILEGFTKELQKGVDSREELKSLLDKQKDEFLKVKKEMGISDDKKLDTVLYNAKERVFERTQKLQKEFVFGKYDVDVVFKYIENAQGCLSIESLKEQLDKEYTDEEYSDKQFKYLTKRLDDNFRLGTVGKSEDGSYYITDEGKTKARELKESRENERGRVEKKGQGRERKR